MIYLRQHVAAFTAYTIDWREVWPVVTQPGPWMGFPARAPCFAASTVWARPLITAGSYPDGAIDVFFNPDSPLASVPGPDGDAMIPGRISGYTRYIYDCAFLADPLFWSTPTRCGPVQWRSNRAHEVLFPADQALLVGFFLGFPTICPAAALAPTPGSSSGLWIVRRAGSTSLGFLPIRLPATVRSGPTLGPCTLTVSHPAPTHSMACVDGTCSVAEPRPPGARPAATTQTGRFSRFRLARRIGPC